MGDLIERIAAGRKRFLYPSDRDFDIVGNMVVAVPLAMFDLLLEAADEITALRQEVERLKAGSPNHPEIPDSSPSIPARGGGA